MRAFLLRLPKDVELVHLCFYILTAFSHELQIMGTESLHI